MIACHLLRTVCLNQIKLRTKHRRRLSGNAALEAYEMPKPKVVCGGEPITAFRSAHRRWSGSLMMVFW
jgi:hypothetical protein